MSVDPAAAASWEGPCTQRRALLMQSAPSSARRSEDRYSSSAWSVIGLWRCSGKLSMAN